MAQPKRSLDYYLAQTRRIAEHREAGAEKEIRKLYKSMLNDLQEFVSEAYVKYAEEDKLTFAMLQKAGYDARFLEEVEQRINVATPKAAKELRKLVEETYKLAYEGMVDGVQNAATVPLGETFAEWTEITPEQIKAAVENPVSGLTLKDTLEKNRREIIYSIKQTVGVGLMNGDRYTTMARRIAEQVDGDYKKAVRIARTEAHRVREAGNANAAEAVDQAIQRGKSGLRMVKTWKTMKDERVRPQRRRKGKRGWSTTMGKGPNHMKLDGQTVLADEEFDLQDGHTAKAPGQSGVAGHDIHCRCYASYHMMTDSEFFAKTGRHFPGYDGHESVENTGKSGIIESKYGFNSISGEHTREQDLAATNPNYSTRKREWTHNCQRCVSAYEARRRGFDVEALPRILDGSDRMPYMFDHKEGWTSVYKNINPILCSSNRTAGVLKKAEEAMQSFGDGARAIVRVQWQARYGGGGHVFIAEQTDGKTIFIDPQSNKNDVRHYFSMAKLKETYVMRIDNLEFTDNIVKCCKNKK